MRTCILSLMLGVLAMVSVPLMAATPSVLDGREVPFGRLGYRLGSYLTIEGKRADGPKSGTQTLLVDMINGKRVANPIGIWIDNANLPPKFACTIKGYETIRTLGIPPARIVAARETGKHIDLPQAGWQVQPYFVALSDVAITDATLKGDPAVALRSGLPKGWAILKVQENSFPSDLPQGNGKAIFLRPRNGEAADVIVYIMPAGYQDGRDYPRDERARTIPAKLIATVPTARIYVWERFGQLSAPGWVDVWDDIPLALLKQQ